MVEKELGQEEKNLEALSQERKRGEEKKKETPDQSETAGREEHIASREGELHGGEKEGIAGETLEGMRSFLRSPKKKKPTKIPQVRDELTLRIEKIMEDGLKEAYTELTPIEREEFKIEGEKTAIKIRALLKATHVRVKKIFKLLFAWLKLLPGVNRFFLQQEAKIKTDKIISLKHLDAGQFEKNRE